MVSPVSPFQTELAGRIEALNARGRPRVWSLVVTVFGDAVVPRGGRVALAALQEIVGRLGIEPGALRTAMSRLAADGWVIREREGRNSFFRLADDGRHAFDLATRRIYSGSAPPWAGGWTVAVAAPGAETAAASELAALGFVGVAQNVFLRPDTGKRMHAASLPAGLLVIHGTSAEHPEALRDLWPSDDIAQAYRGFTAGWSGLAHALHGAPPSPLDAIAARTLLIHEWRRIVLRDPGLPGELLPAGWPAEQARVTASAIYAGLLGPSETWLDEAGLPAPTDGRMLAARFGGGANED